MMKLHKRLAAVLLAFTCAIINAASLKEIAAALDMDVAFLVKQEYRKYAYDEIGFTIYDDDNNPLYQYNLVNGERHLSTSQNYESTASTYRIQFTIRYLFN